jgi:hypothetical protein
MEPGLLSLQGRLGHHVLEAAVDAVRGGPFPGWQVAYEGIGVELVRGPARPSTGWLDPGMARDALTPSMAELPRRVWVIVLEEGMTGRREVMKYLLVGGNEESPAWERIRADASVPIQARQPAGGTRHKRIRKRREDEDAAIPCTDPSDSS